MSQHRGPRISAVAGAAGGLLVTWSSTWWIAGGWMGVGAIAGAGAWIDATTRRIPNRLTLTGLCFVLVAAIGGSIIEGASVLMSTLSGAAIGGAVFLLLFLAGQAGGGDFKLAAVLGSAAGLISTRAALLTAIGMCVAVEAVGLVVMIRRGRTATFPLGPALLCGALAGVLTAHPWWAGV
jgi:leader peptidase (prepilin peptidase) / N-methyltransferase